MGNTIDGIGSASTTPNYEVDKPKAEGPPPEKKAEGRSFLDVTASAIEALTTCTGLGTMSPTYGMLATFINEKQKGKSIPDAIGYATAKTVAEMSAHAALEGAHVPYGGQAVQLLTCVDDVKEVATGKSYSEKVIEGSLAAKTLDPKAVTDAATAALATKKAP